MHSRREGIIDGSGSPGDRGTFPWLSDGSLGSGLPAKWNVFRWLRHLLWPISTGEPSKPLRPTAYLDGLRGFCAFLVYIHHHELWAHGAFNYFKSLSFENAFGWRGEYYFATFFGIRNFFTGGHLAVGSFYVISGYVLTVKPLQLIQSGELAKLGDNLASAFFRRWFRLFIPLIVTTFIYVTSWHVFGYWNFNCAPKATIGEEWWNWYVEFKNFSFLFKEGPPWVTYNTHLWSIPLEMRGSMVVFMASLALSRATTKARLICEAFMAFYFLYIVDGFYCALFMAGMLQCDLDLLARRSDGYFPSFLRRLEPYKTFIYYHLFVMAMWLGGVPSGTTNIEDVRNNPGWYWMSFLKPQAVYDPKWFYLFFGANMLVACIPRISWLKRFFESRFCQFLGRISFALYLVHGPILAALGDRIYHVVGWVRTAGDHTTELNWWANRFPLPKIGPYGLEIAFLVPHIILLPLTLWMADVVTRMVDEPSVKFAAWLYKRTIGGGTEPKPEEQAVALMRLA